MPLKQRRCPTPQKRRFPTHGAAARKLGRDDFRHNMFAPVRVYKCGDHYHLTSRPLDQMKGRR